MVLPKISVVFLSFRQERFVEEALRAALAQDLPEFELIVADDASPDGTWQIIERILDEPRRPGISVKAIRQPKNLGILANFNAALAMAAGEVFVLMAGDDVSYPSRARKMAEAFASDSTLRAVSCASRVVDARGDPIVGRPPDLRSGVFEHGKGRRDPYAGAPVTGACAAYHRSLLDVFGPLPPDASGEDVDFIFRALLLGRVQYYGEVLMDYRQHGGNICNYSAVEISDKDLEKKEIWASEANAHFDRQWSRDLKRALELGILSAGRAKEIHGLIERHAGRHALAALSLKVSPWSEWRPAAGRLLRRGDFVKTFKLLLLRLFESRRKAHWAWVRRRKGQ